MKLDRARAEAAIARVAKPLGLTNVEAAAGIVKVVNHNMAAALRIHTAERGKDYRKYPLFAFGGAGPVHACEIARLLKLPKVICPLGAGTNSALGLLVAPPAVDLSRSYYGRLDALDWDFLDSLYRDMETQGRRMLAEAGIAQPAFSREAEMRFVGQGFEVTAAIPSGTLNADAVATIKRAFFESYGKLYRSLPGDLPIEGLTWRLRAAGPAPEIRASHAGQRAVGESAPKAKRPAYFADAGEFVMTPVYDRYLMQAGASVDGPAIIEERESTVVAPPGTRVTVDSGQNVTIEWPHRN
jgi:N-methylhydantoinase A